MTEIDVTGPDADITEYMNTIGKIALLADLGRYFGRKLNPESRGPRYQWKSQGLTVYVNDAEHFLLTYYRSNLVCSTVPDNLLFSPGPWWQIVEGMREQIQAAQEKAERARRREAVANLMAQVAAWGN